MMIQITSLLVVTMTLSPPGASAAAFARLNRPARHTAAFRHREQPRRAGGSRLNYHVNGDMTLLVEEAAPTAAVPVDETTAAPPAAPLVDSAQLEALIIDEFEEGPLVVNVFASSSRSAADPRHWRMGDDYDAAARELSGKVRMVKFDVDEDRDMARRLSVSRLPTLLFLDSYDWDRHDEEGSKLPIAVLKERLHYGSIRKEALKARCERHYGFGGVPRLDSPLDRSGMKSSLEMM